VRFTRKRFFLTFVACAFAFDVATRFLLNQPPNPVWASPEQAAWQRHASTILSPLMLVLTGPIDWLQQDPDPPPPFRAILCVGYWTIVALLIHQLVSRGGRARQRNAL
jgi:hypothetical protein